MIWNFDPVALSVFGLDVRWYGLGYVVSFFLVLELGWRLLRTMSAHTISKKQWENLLFGMFVAGILGGRLGEFVFFSADILWENPMQVLYIWQGGMSIHGGIIGGSLYAWYFCRVHQLSLWRCFDAIALPLSIGLGVGRITNFINGELVGKPTHADWGVIFPHVDQLLRHPTQLYESLSMFLLAVFLFFMWKKSGKKNRGIYDFLLCGWVWRFTFCC